MGYAFLLLAFIKLLFLTESPRMVAGLYTALLAVGVLIGTFGGSIAWPTALFRVALGGILTFGYFSCLLRANRWTGQWWAIAVGGAVLMAIVTSL